MLIVANFEGAQQRRRRNSHQASIVQHFHSERGSISRADHLGFTRDALLT